MNISIASINVGTYMIGEVDSSWKNIQQERHNICEKIIRKNSENNVHIICTQEDILLSDYQTDGTYETEFHELYAKYHYFALSQCAFQDNTSHVIQNLHPGKYIKLGNVIYIHTSLIYDVIPVPPPYPKYACIAYCIIYGKVTLANVHLCGGRFDDQLVFQDETTYIEKLKQIRSIEPSTIICGDMNSTRFLGKPGGLKCWSYPTLLANSLEFRSGYPPVKTSKNMDLSIDEKAKWETWQCAPIEYLFTHPTFQYKCCFNDEQLTKIGETTCRGKYIVDWIFYQTREIQCKESKIIKMYGDFIHTLSDHHMIFSTFGITT